MYITLLNSASEGAEQVPAKKPRLDPFADLRDAASA